MGLLKRISRGHLVNFGGEEEGLGVEKRFREGEGRVDRGE